MNEELKKKLISAAEELDWHVMADEDSWEFEKFSPAGEDFCFATSTGDVARDVMDYYENFDAEDHVVMLMEAKKNGLSGVPSVKVLVQDADDIDEMLMDLANALHQVEEEWYENQEDD